MTLHSNLLSTDYGLTSLAVIVFILGMSVFFYSFIKHKMVEDEKNAGV